MKELRKNHIVQIELRDKTQLDGIIFDYTDDRIMILIAYNSLQQAKNLQELDSLMIKINTHLGLKRMFTHIISKLDKNNCIVIENNSAINVPQKRQFVRVLSNVNFKIIKSDETIVDCSCINISAGGIAFVVNDFKFELNEHVLVELSETDFGKRIDTSAKIIKVFDSYYVAQFTNLDKYDEDKIVKYVFKLITK